MITERKPLAVGDRIYIYGVDSVTHDAMRVKAQVTEVNGDKIFALAKGAYKPVSVHRRQCVLIKPKRKLREYWLIPALKGGYEALTYRPAHPDAIHVREVLKK